MGRKPSPFRLLEEEQHQREIDKAKAFRSRLATAVNAWLNYYHHCPRRTRTHHARLQQYDEAVADFAESKSGGGRLGARHTLQCLQTEFAYHYNLTHFLE
jgi:Rad3-related DNA helicase